LRSGQQRCLVFSGLGFRVLFCVLLVCATVCCSSVPSSPGSTPFVACLLGAVFDLGNGGKFFAAKRPKIGTSVHGIAQYTSVREVHIDLARYVRCCDVMPVLSHEHFHWQVPDSAAVFLLAVVLF
jgi:hypothetical protein